MSILSISGKIAPIVFLLILILALLLGGLIWLDFLGLINAKARLSPLISFLGIQSLDIAEQPFSPVSLDEDRLAKERQALAIEQQELEQAIEDFLLREAELNQKEGEVAEREKSVEERQISLNESIRQYDNKVANLEQTARYMMGMPPPDAIAIMDQYDVKDLVDLLRTSERLSREAGETSLVSYWLSIMSNRSRAAEIQHLLVEKPGLSLNE